jgi:hypothetical protein
MTELDAMAAQFADAALPFSDLAGADLTYAGNPRAPHHLTLTW